MRSLDFSIYLTVPASLMSLGCMSLQEKYVPQIFLVRWLSRQCAILNISQPHKPPQPGAGIALLFAADMQRHGPHLRLSLYFRKCYWHRTLFLFCIWDFLNFYTDGLTCITRCWLCLMTGICSSMAEFVWFCKTITSLSIMAAQPHYMKWCMLSLLWLFITSDS
jgi:hypothetical protein